MAWEERLNAVVALAREFSHRSVSVFVLTFTVFVLSEIYTGSVCKEKFTNKNSKRYVYVYFRGYE